MSNISLDVAPGFTTLMMGGLKKTVKLKSLLANERGANDRYVK